MNEVAVYIIDSSFLSDPSYFELASKLIRSSRLEKALSYVTTESRNNCIAGELMLRFALKQVGIELSQWKIKEGEHGKPILVGCPYFYNLTHSGTKVVLALSSQEVGIDIETKKEAKLGIAEAYFQEEENAALLASKSKNELFLKLWTAKEAYSKYLGLGLALPLNAANVLALAKGISSSIETSFGKAYGQYIELDEAFICLVSKSISALKLVPVTAREILRK